MVRTGTAARRSKRPSKAGDLQLKRRTMLLAVLLVPLLAALYGFLDLQNLKTVWPDPLVERTPRGRILTQDGVVLAEGANGARVYPQGSLGAHIVGFSGDLQAEGNYGLEGLELKADGFLQAGHDLVTTLDSHLQAVAQTKLAETVRTTAAENGAVVILEAGTGRIVAAASYPDYDPNTQGKLKNRDHILNKAFIRRFEPGSVMKPFVVAALLESGRLSLSETIDTPMQLKEGDKLFRDVAKHDPKLLPQDVLRYSSNSGMINLTKRFSDTELRTWLWHFGFGQLVDIPLETSRGVLRETPWVPQDQASITIGQSLSTNALQLATAYSIFANDGVYIPPYLVEGTTTEAPRRIITPEVAHTTRALLQYTAEQSSISSYLVPNVSLAGKTGTADIFDPEQGRYIKGDYTLTFAGMMPADKPKFTMVVTVQKPRTDDSSTSVAVPLFTAIASEVVALWQLPPSSNAYATTE